MNGLHKALFILAPALPAPVSVRRRDVATGIIYLTCVFVCVCVGAGRVYDKTAKSYIGHDKAN